MKWGKERSHTHARKHSTLCPRYTFNSNSAMSSWSWNPMLLCVTYYCKGQTLTSFLMNLYFVKGSRQYVSLTFRSIGKPNHIIVRETVQKIPPFDGETAISTKCSSKGAQKILFSEVLIQFRSFKCGLHQTNPKRKMFACPLCCCWQMASWLSCIQKDCFVTS